jgi:outer membrane receptor protein involved in Fe transport
MFRSPQRRDFRGFVQIKDTNCCPGLFPVVFYPLITTRTDMKKLTFYGALLLFSLALVPSFAQSLGKISGQITDANQQAVAAANVILRKAIDSSVVKMAFSDPAGKFEIEDLKYGEYQVEVSFLGAKTYRSDLLQISEKTPNLQLPAIALQTGSAVELEGVTVKAQKAFIEQKIDRTIVNPEVLISNAGLSIWEVLEKSPGVRADDSGGLSLKGKEGVMVFIDDKPTYLAGEDLMNYLRSLPAGTIDKIELITNPPAKYDAAGNAGVINIRTKKTQVKGTTGNVNLGYSQGVYPKANNSMNFNIRENKFNFFSNLGQSLRTNFADLDLERRFLTEKGALASSFDQNSDIYRSNNGVNGKVGIDYFANPMTTLGFVATGMFREGRNTTRNTSYLRDGFSRIDSIIGADNLDENQFNNLGLNLNLRRQNPKTNREFGMDADFITYATRAEQLYKNFTYNADQVLVRQDDVIGDLPSELNIYAIKADYAQPLGKKGRFEAGAKSSLIRTQNDAEYFRRFQGVTRPDFNLTNYFTYRENINAAYLNANQEWGRLGVQAGLRLENTILQGNQLALEGRPDSSFQRNYTSLFPTFYLSFQADSLDNHHFGFNFNRRIERPFYQDLNPFLSPLDKYTFYVGNPFLLPVFSNNFEFSYTFKRRWTAALTLGFANNLITETIDFEGEFYYSRPNNIASRTTTSLTINGSVNPRKFWTLIVGSEGTRLGINTELYGQKIDTAGYLGFVNLNNVFQLGKGWSAEAGAWYRSGVLFSQIAVIQQWQATFGLAKRVMKNKGTIKLSIADPFYTRINAGQILFLGNINSSYRNLGDTRFATLNFSYNFSRGQGAKGPRKTGSADEENGRVKGNG